MSDALTVSVIIPTRNRRETVLLAVQALRRARTQPLEILVVDDGSIDGTAGLLHSHNLQATLLSTGRSPLADLNAVFGAAHARNVGLKAARGSLVAFMDDDIVHLGDPVGVTCEAFSRRARMALVSGHHYTVRHGEPATWLMEGPHCTAPEHPCAWWFAVTAYHAWQVNGYDERFTAYGGEDVDFARRLSRLGLDTVADANLIAVHLDTGPRPQTRCKGPEFQRQRLIANTDLSIERNVGVPWGVPWGMPRGECHDH